ncbi:MAG: DUF2062 domain-containing protein [Flavobacterium sp.]|nr:DUF2062 domain-containing protein [Flavobacterium sp.]
MFWLKLLRDILKIFREGESPKQIAWGFALGSIVGLSPSLNLQGIIVWLLILILNVNLGAAVLGFTIFGLIAFLFDPLFHQFGFFLLTQFEFLRGTYTTLYNAPVAPLSKFNNTVVIGSFVSALILLYPVYLGMRLFIIKYREHIGAKVHKWKIYQVINRSTLVRWYTKVRDLGGLR